MKRVLLFNRVHPRQIALLLIASLLASCWIPRNDWELDSRRNVTPGTTTTLQEGVGTATLADVLLQLGEPDVVSEDGRRLTYQWTKIEGMFIIGAMYMGSARDVTRASAIEVTFDERGYLVSAELLYGKLHLD